MFTDPQSVTLSGVATSLPRVGNDETSSIYRSADGNLLLRISHGETKSGRIRHEIRLERKIIAPDPHTAENTSYTMTVYTVIDRPLAGFTNAQIRDAVLALVGWETTANLDRVVGLEL